jgi:hypothetical protein
MRGVAVTTIRHPANRVTAALATLAFRFFSCTVDPGVFDRNTFALRPAITSLVFAPAEGI